ncbi:ribosome assembly RNA-binding protein YhbY [Corallococcus carmarthensis]|uniref:Ribosome assembly RNA-binding protein YhbY n=1 Tax=Corallococcus carmarthensis TaxID=2316728 RepID=A0A3A8JG85_9BACT|nr:ribosome assembly RNA-binding protein YhbY [Corallococcus carmarthensis]NOK23364.1 ribosome assembly RNA-binding protein YhbY [Corallococcus carmarthensis]RKG93996.1 ribosome assembly RNA-binding protein YhbY [Corallococcus carmarthensis]
MPLTGKERRHLRALGHHLEPVVIVGSSGVTEGVIAAIEQALNDHELIKVKINEGPEGRHEAADRLAEATGSELAQLLGRTALFFKRRKQKSHFEDILKGPHEPRPAPKPAEEAKPRRR